MASKPKDRDRVRAINVGYNWLRVIDNAIENLVTKCPTVAQLPELRAQYDAILVRYLNLDTPACLDTPPSAPISAPTSSPS